MAYLRPPNTILAGTALTQDPSPLPTDPSGAIAVQLSAQISSTQQLGVVQIGDGLSITEDGILSADAQGCNCWARNIDSDYEVQATDYYIGVTADGPVIIILPEDPPDCLEFVIKADMPPPLGTRKITILPQGANTIDGDAKKILKVAYESVNIISQGTNWHII
jgi:hypothetical protein